MTLLGKGHIESFTRRHAQAKAGLASWKQLIEANQFQHFSQLRQVFASVDYVKPHTVFDVGGNKFRVIALVDYATMTVLITNVLTHAEYDRGAWRKS